MAEGADGSEPDPERERALRTVQREALWSNLTNTVTSGAILGAFAVYMGASNLVIGLLAAAPFLAQLLQIPAVLLIERLRQRRVVAVWSSVIGRAALLVIAVAAFMPGTGLGVSLLVLMQFLFCAMGAVGGCAWNAWLRDLVPDRQLGAVVARRTRYGAIVGMIAGLVAAVALDLSADNALGVAATYAGLYAAGFGTGMVSAYVVSRIPEPPMARASYDVSIWPMLKAPLKEKNFRRVMMFLGSWQFAVNFASPFFTVYLLRQRGLDITLVMLMSIASQIANIVTLRSWGALADRFSNKSVLTFVAPLYLLSIAGFAVASQFEPGWGLMVYLVVLHAAMGGASAGVTLATANIVLKQSPRGEAAAWLATSALVTAGAAGAAAILGGLLAEFFSARQLELIVRWTNPEGVLTFEPLRLSNWDFYFILAALMGLFALHRLAFVQEVGEIDRRAMVEQVMMQARRTMRGLSSTVAIVTEIPGALVREAGARARLRQLKEHQAATAPPPTSKPG